MSNTREDSNSGQSSDARQKAHKGNFRHQANVDDDDVDHDDDDYVGQQYGVLQHQHQVTMVQRPHDAGQRSDLEQRSGME